MATLLQHFDNLVFVFRENFGETIGPFHEIVLGCSGNATSDKAVRVVDFGSESQKLASFLCDGDGVTSQHFDAETKVLSFNDGVCGIFARRIEHRQHANDLPWFVATLGGDTKGTEATTCEVGCSVTVMFGGCFVALGNCQDSLGCTFGELPTLAFESTDGGDALGDRIERDVLFGFPALLQDLASLGVALQGEDCNFVDWVQRFQIVRRCKCSTSHHPVDIFAFGNIGLADRQLIGCEGTGLIGAENINTLEQVNYVSRFAVRCHLQPMIQLQSVFGQ